MATNYGRFDTLKGREVWAVPICLILGAGLLYWGFNYISKVSHYQTPSQEVRAVQSQENQDFCSKDTNELEKLMDKYRRQK